MSFSLHKEARELEKLIWLKHYMYKNGKYTFTLGLNAAKNIDYIENSFK